MSRNGGVKKLRANHIADLAQGEIRDVLKYGVRDIHIVVKVKILMGLEVVVTGGINIEVLGEAEVITSDEGWDGMNKDVKVGDIVRKKRVEELAGGVGGNVAGGSGGRVIGGTG
jgi:hypothetical protein